MRPGALIGVAALAGLLLSLSAPTLSHKRTPQASVRVSEVAQQPPSAPITVVGSILEGRLVSLSGTTLTVEDVFGAQQRVQTDASTDVLRGTGYTYFSDHDLSRLRLGDYLWIAGNAVDRGVFQAGRITANGFIGRDGIVTDRGHGFIDVRLRKSRPR